MKTNKSLIVLASPYYIFSARNFDSPLNFISQESVKILYSTLLVENYLKILNSKKYNIDLIIPEDDYEYLPGIFHSIHTKIHKFRLENLSSDLEPIQKIIFKGDYRKILILNGYISNLKVETLDFTFNSIPEDSEKIILFVDEKNVINGFATNESKFSLIDILLKPFKNYDLLIRKILSLDAEIQVINEFNSCTTINDLISVYYDFKKQGQKQNSLYINQFFNHFSKQLTKRMVQD